MPDRGLYESLEAERQENRFVLLKAKSEHCGTAAQSLSSKA